MYGNILQHIGNIVYYIAHVILLKHENICDTDITSPNITRWRYYWKLPNPTLVNVDIGHARDQKVAKWIGTGLSPPETLEVVGVT